jgi:hypothetical protein
VYTLRSSNPSVVQVQPSVFDRRVYVKAVAAGMATLTFDQLAQAFILDRTPRAAHSTASSNAASNIPPCSISGQRRALSTDRRIGRHPGPD